jgi:hypothetical protein
MPRDRDQLTPDEPEDRGLLAPEATRAIDDEHETPPEHAPGGASLGAAAGSGDPPARDEVAADEKDKYR